MPHTGYHGNHAGRDGPGDFLAVESPQVFPAATATPHQHDIQFVSGQTGHMVDPPECPGDFPGSGLALNQHREQADLGDGPTPAQGFQHILQRRGVGTGHNADPFGIQRQRPFAGHLKKAFGHELLLQLAKGQLQFSLAHRCDPIGDELQPAMGAVVFDFSGDADGQAVFQLETQGARQAGPCRHRNRTTRIFQGEIEMSGTHRPPVVGNLAFHQNP